jgi:asparagine synthase (glutamine-hydrolysing)
MCGIAGKLYQNESPELKTVTAMCDRMHRRGPDNFGIKLIDNLVLGHRRLSIIDLSCEANQPMTSLDNRFHIVYNGEIYNYLEIKNDLDNKGYIFSTKSDTEVIINAFHEYGPSCFNKFNGMFSLALYDLHEKKLILARDRFGKKPLFYHKFSNGSFSFASQVDALLSDIKIESKLNFEALNHYLALGYILNPITQYEGIFLLEPATYLIVNTEGIIIEKTRYWNYADYFRNKTSKKEAEIAEELYFLLDQAVKLRLASDVPLGAFLSGGLDSSSIVAIMKKYFTSELHTFSVGFKNDTYNELPDANKVSDYIGTIHHTLNIDYKNASDLIPFIEAFDQLFADNSLIPMLEVSKLAKQHVTVVLSGDGADELFSGYITYNADKFYHAAKWLPLLLRTHLGKEKQLYNQQKLSFAYKARQFFSGTQFNYQKAHFHWRSIFTPEQRIAILGKQYRDIIYDTDPFYVFSKYYQSVSDLEIMDQHYYVDAMTWLTDDILTKVDRTTMYNSLEARAPYLDYNLAEFAASIPSKIKFKNNRKKYILKKSLKPYLPEFVINKKKSGFNSPISNWLPGSSEYNEFRAFNKFVFEHKVSIS